MKWLTRLTGHPWFALTPEARARRDLAAIETARQEARRAAQDAAKHHERRKPAQDRLTALTHASLAVGTGRGR